VKFLNEKYKLPEFTIYLENKHKELVDGMLHYMEFDLISFNKDKSLHVRDFISKIAEINLYQNLGQLYRKEMLNQSLYKLLMATFFYIYFSSVDYKIPEKKPAESDVPLQGTEENGSKKDLLTEQNTEENRDTDRERPEGQEGQEVQEGQEGQPLAGDQQNQEGNNVVEQPAEEEFKLPEITPLEQETVQAKSKIKIEFVENWKFQSDFDVLARFRIPLQREGPTERTDPKTGTIDSENNNPGEVENAKDDQNTQTDQNPEGNQAEVKASVEGQSIEPKEENKEEQKVINDGEEPDEFIEPYDGSTFEKEKETFMGKNSHLFNNF